MKIFVRSNFWHWILSSHSKYLEKVTPHVIFKKKNHRDRNQCCWAETFFLALAPDIFFFVSSSRSKILAPAPPIKAQLRSAPAPAPNFFFLHLKNLNFNEKALINLDFVTPHVIFKKKNHPVKSFNMTLYGRIQIRTIWLDPDPTKSIWSMWIRIRNTV